MKESDNESEAFKFNLQKPEISPEDYLRGFPIKRNP